MGFGAPGLGYVGREKRIGADGGDGREEIGIAAVAAFALGVGVEISVCD